MQNKQLAVFGVVAWIVSVFASAEDLSGASIAPTWLLLLSVIMGLGFVLLSSIRLWKTDKITVIAFVIFYFSNGFGVLLSNALFANIIKIIQFTLCFWVICLLWQYGKRDGKKQKAKTLSGD